MCDWQVFVGFVALLLELTQKQDAFGFAETTGARRDQRASQTQSNLMLSSLQELSCPCSANAFFCGHNKTIQPASHPPNQLLIIRMPPMLVSHAMLIIEDPNQKINNLLTEVWWVHAGSREQLDPRGTYQPGSGRKEVCTCGPVVPLHTTPCLMNRYRAG